METAPSRLLIGEAKLAKCGTIGECMASICETEKEKNVILDQKFKSCAAQYFVIGQLCAKKKI